MRVQNVHRGVGRCLISGGGANFLSVTLHACFEFIEHNINHKKYAQSAETMHWNIAFHRNKIPKVAIFNIGGGGLIEILGAAPLPDPTPLVHCNPSGHAGLESVLTSHPPPHFLFHLSPVPPSFLPI